MFSLQQLRQLVEQNYDLKIAKISRLGQGLQNKQFLARLDSGEKLTIRLTTPRSTTKERLLKISKIQDFLANKGLPVKKIYKTKSGKFFLELKNGYFLQVFSFIEGHWAKTKGLEKYIQVSGKFLAEFHQKSQNNLESITLRRFSLNSYIADVEQRLMASAKIPQKYQASLKIKTSLGHLINLMKNDLHCLDAAKFGKDTYTFLHGDYQPGNYKFTDHQVSGLYDFDLCTFGPIYFDIGFGITHWFFALNDQEPNFVLQNFIQGYEEIRKFNKSELDLIFDFVLITAIERISSCFFYFNEYRDKEHWKNETNYYLAKYKKLQNLRNPVNHLVMVT